jgi:hypothetical protein
MRRPRDAVANTGHRRALVLVLNSHSSDDGLFYTMHSPATIAATASSDLARVGKFNAAFCLSEICAETTIVTRD